MPASGKKILFLQFQPVAGYPPLMNLMRKCSQRAETRLLYLKIVEHALPLPTDLAPLVLATCAGGAGRLGRMFARCFYALTALKAVWTGSYDVVVVTDANAAWLGCLIRPVLRGKLVYVEYDTPTAVGWRAMIQWAGRNRLARIADMVLVPNSMRLYAVLSESGRTAPAARLANFPPPEEIVRDPLSEISGEDPQLRLYYQGTLVPERLPEALFAAVAARKTISLTIRGLRTIPDNGYFDQLTALIRSYKIEHQVHLLPPLPARELRAEAARHHVGIAFFNTQVSDVNLRSMWGASNKIYQYMAYGLLVLYSSGEEELVNKMQGFGLRCDATDPESIVAAIDYICRHPTEVQTMREHARRKIADEWNFETEFQAAFEPLLR